MKHNLVVFGVFSIVILSSGCAPAAKPPTPAISHINTPQPSPEIVQPRPDTLPATPPRCGDGICDGPENAQNCTADCATTPETPSSPPGASSSPSKGTTYTIQNPTSGAQLRVHVYMPENAVESPFPALVLVPGGNGSSADFRKPGRTAIPIFTGSGFAVVLFDPDGRGESSGEEDYNGFTQQDGLAAVIEFAASLPEVDTSQIGVVSYSYGITMASGALARHPDLPVRFLIDWEGPANRDDTGGCDGAGLGHLQEVASCDDEAFWAEREAATFARSLRIPYLRLQSEKDHVQPDYTHALLMVNNATAVEYGGNGQSPWTRLNNLPPNQVYDLNSPPPMMPESMDRQREALIAEYARELLALP